MDPNEAFSKRYNDNVALFNAQMQESGLPPHVIAASAAYATARFSVWATATSTLTATELESRRQYAIDTFLDGFRQMLNEHFDDFTQNYSTHFQHKPGVVTR